MKGERRYFIMILNKNHTYYLRAINITKDKKPIVSIMKDGNKYILDRERILWLKNWNPDRTLNPYNPINILREYFFKSRDRIGLFLFREPDTPGSEVQPLINEYIHNTRFKSEVFQDFDVSSRLLQAFAQNRLWIKYQQRLPFARISNRMILYIVVLVIIVMIVIFIMYTKI